MTAVEPYYTVRFRVVWEKKYMGNNNQELSSIVDLKTSDDDFQVEYEVLSLDPRVNKINSAISDLDEKIRANQERLNELDKSIDRLTNHADGVDYAIAVISGVITGIIDATVVGEWDFAKAQDSASENINNKVIAFAKKQPNYLPYCNTTLENTKKNPPTLPTPRRKPKNPDSLETAIDFLEFQFHLPGDSGFQLGKFGIDGNTHRLDDFCHHPTLVGLVCCVIVQFTGNTRYVNKYGEDINIPITVNEYGNFVGKNPVTKLFAGVINWFITCAKTIANRKGHLMSDIATPASIPGNFLSIITELASIPCFRDAEFLTKLRSAYVKGIGTESGQISLGAFNKLFEGASSKFDAKTEAAIAHELKRQAMPIVINEVLVRGSYFIRHFVTELKEKNDVAKVEWNNIIPFNNRTIVRMMTIASGTFTAVDMADAAAHAATKSVDAATFFSNMLLRVNFVGVGRFTVAVVTDIGMGVSREIKCNQRIHIYEEQIALTNAKVFYKQADTWISAEKAGDIIEKAYKQIETTSEKFVEAMKQNANELEKIGEYVPNIEKKNQGLIDEINDILEWE